MQFQQYRPSRFDILPPVVKNLLIINGLFFLATLVFHNRLGIDLTNTLGLHFPLSEEFRPHQLVTYMFMHGNFTHLFFNMFALWMFGNTLENLWGSKRFLIYFIVTGIGAAVCHYIVVYIRIEPLIAVLDGYVKNPSLHDFSLILNADLHQRFKEFVDAKVGLGSVVNDSQLLSLSVDFVNQIKMDVYNNIPAVVGASGSVFGILMAFGMLFPNTLLYIYFAIPIKAKWFVLLYGLAELFSGLMDNPGDNVAHFAHLGGMLFGFILIKYWSKKSSHFY